MCEIFLNGVTIQLTLIGFPKCQPESKLADCQSYQLIIMTILMSPNMITCNFTFKLTGLLSIISLVQISTLYSLLGWSHQGVVEKLLTPCKPGDAISNCFLEYIPHTWGAQWLSVRELDSRPMGRGFEPHRRH